MSNHTGGPLIEQLDPRIIIPGMMGIIPFIISHFSSLLFPQMTDPRALMLRSILYPLVGVISSLTLLQVSQYWMIIPLLNIVVLLCVVGSNFVTNRQGYTAPLISILIPLSLLVATGVQYAIATEKPMSTSETPPLNKTWGSRIKIAA